MLLTKGYVMKKVMLLSCLSLVSLSFASFAMEPEEELKKPNTPSKSSTKRSWRADPNVLQPGEYDTDASKVFAPKVNIINDMYSTEEDSSFSESESQESQQSSEEDSLDLEKLSLADKNNTNDLKK
jgi:hypothetical protein